MITCIKFGKDQSAAFVSHLDLIRVFERAMRRAKLPLRFSQGFSPRPKMVFAHALSLGITSSGEYLDVELEEELNAEEIFSRLKEALPAPFPLYDVANLPDTVTSAMAAITHASYLFQTEDYKRLLEASNIPNLIYTKEKKGKILAEDLKPLITGIEHTATGVRFVVRAGSKKNVRPDALLSVLGIETPTRIHRENLYIEEQGRLITPLMRSE